MKSCPDCGSRVYNHGCVNCNEPAYIQEQIELTARYGEIRHDDEPSGGGGIGRGAPGDQVVEDRKIQERHTRGPGSTLSDGLDLPREGNEL